MTALIRVSEVAARTGLSLRMSFEEVSKWLGHSDVRITQQRYAFLETSHLHDAVARGSGNVVQLRRKTV